MKIQLYLMYKGQFLIQEFPMNEPQQRISIRVAGNTLNPALLALRAKGYRLWLEFTQVNDPQDPWHPRMPDIQAEKDGAYFSAVSTDSFAAR